MSLELSVFLFVREKILVGLRRRFTSKRVYNSDNNHSLDQFNSKRATESPSNVPI